MLSEKGKSPRVHAMYAYIAKLCFGCCRLKIFSMKIYSERGRVRVYRVREESKIMDEK